MWSKTAEEEAGEAVYSERVEAKANSIQGHEKGKTAYQLQIGSARQKDGDGVFLYSPCLGLVAGRSSFPCSQCLTACTASRNRAGMGPPKPVSRGATLLKVYRSQDLVEFCGPHLQIIEPGLQFMGAGDWDWREGKSG